MRTEGRALTRSNLFAKLRGMTVGLLLTFICFVPAAARAQSETAIPGHPSSVPLLDRDSRITRGEDLPPLTNKQKKSIMNSNFEKSKRDAAELAALASQLRDELNKPNVNTLSLESMNRIERIEKLAKKIREEMKGN
jgi:hypothetical protein